MPSDAGSVPQVGHRTLRGTLSATAWEKPAGAWMFVVPRRQQSPRTAEASGEGFLLPCLASWHPGAAGKLF